MTERKLETIVTYLKTNRPPRKAPPYPTGMRLALMSAAPIAVHYYRYLYALVGSNWRWTERSRLSDEDLAGLVQKDGVDVAVLYANGSPAGYYELDRTDRQDVELSYFGLAPDWTGRGLGPWLLATAMSDAFDKGAEILRVNTCTLDHPAALALYQKLGFEPYNQEKRWQIIPPDWEKSG